MNWDYPDPFQQQVRVTAEQIDALEHANNTVYVNWCMSCAWAHTTALGLGADAYRRLDRAMAVTRAEYDYLRAARLGDELEIGTWITGWERRMVMERRVQIIDRATGESALRARLEFVCIEISSGKPKRPPRDFVDIYGPAMVTGPASFA